MSTISADMKFIQHAVDRIDMQMDTAIPAATLSDETGNNLILDVAIASDENYEIPPQVNTESNFIVSNLTKALDWLEDLIRRVWLFVQKGIHQLKGFVRKYLGHASWLKRIFVKFEAAFRAIENKRPEVKACEWRNKEHPINLMGMNGFDQANFPEECKRLVHLVSYIKGDYLITSEKFAGSFTTIFESATRLTPNEVVDHMNSVLKQVQVVTGVDTHPIQQLKREGQFQVKPMGKGEVSSYDSTITHRSVVPYLGGHCFMLSRSAARDGSMDRDEYRAGLLEEVNTGIRFGIDHSLINKTARIQTSDVVHFTNEPSWLRESCQNLITAIDLVHELYTDTRFLDIEAEAKRVQKGIDAYFTTIRNNGAYSDTAGEHIGFIRMGTKFISNIMQPLQGVPTAIIRIGSSFVSLSEAALESYHA